MEGVDCNEFGISSTVQCVTRGLCCVGRTCCMRRRIVVSCQEMQ